MDLSEADPPAPPHLLTLPLEISLQIWTNVLTLPSQPVRVTNEPKSSHSCLSLLLVCRRVYTEAAPLFYSCNHLYVEPYKQNCHACRHLQNNPPGLQDVAESSKSCQFGCKAKPTEPPILAFLTSLSAVRLSSIRTLTVELDPSTRRTDVNLRRAFRMLVTHCPHLRAFYLVLEGINPRSDCGPVKGLNELMRLRGLEECGVRGRQDWETLSDKMRRLRGDINPGIVQKWLMKRKGVVDVVWEESKGVTWEIQGVQADRLRAAWKRPRVETSPGNGQNHLDFLNPNHLEPGRHQSTISFIDLT